MGLRQLEAAILRELRVVTGNKKLRQKDIMQWSSGTISGEPGENLAFLPVLKINVAYVLR